MFIHISRRIHGRKIVVIAQTRISRHIPRTPVKLFINIASNRFLLWSSSNRANCYLPHFRHRDPRCFRQWPKFFPERIPIIHELLDLFAVTKRELNRAKTCSQNKRSRVNTRLGELSNMPLTSPLSVENVRPTKLHVSSSGDRSHHF